MQQPAEAKELYSEMIAACVAAFDDSENRRNDTERFVQQLNLAVSGDGESGCGGDAVVGGDGDVDGGDGDKSSSR